MAAQKLCVIVNNALSSNTIKENLLRYIVYLAWTVPYNINSIDRYIYINFKYSKVDRQSDRHLKRRGRKLYDSNRTIIIFCLLLLSSWIERHLLLFSPIPIFPKPYTECLFLFSKIEKNNVKSFVGKYNFRSLEHKL